MCNVTTILHYVQITVAKTECQLILKVCIDYALYLQIDSRVNWLEGGINYQSIDIRLPNDLKVDSGGIGCEAMGQFCGFGYFIVNSLHTIDAPLVLGKEPICMNRSVFAGVVYWSGSRSRVDPPHSTMVQSGSPMQVKLHRTERLSFLWPCLRQKYPFSFKEPKMFRMLPDIQHSNKHKHGHCSIIIVYSLGQNEVMQFLRNKNRSWWPWAHLAFCK